MEHTMLVWAQSVKQLCTKSMEPMMTEFDLSTMEIGIILFLAESPACDTCRDIADHLLLAKSNVSTAVDRLVQKGYATQAALLRELLAGFTPEEVQQMRHLEQKLLERIRQVLKNL